MFAQDVMLYYKKALGGLYMKHSVIFSKIGNNWDNALPLGNGCLGAMIYYNKGKLFAPLNHYEIYYNIREDVLPKDKLNKFIPTETPGRIHTETVERADRNRPSGQEPYCDFRTDKRYVFDQNDYGIDSYSGSYPSTGNLVYSFDKNIDSR